MTHNRRRLLARGGAVAIAVTLGAHKAADAQPTHKAAPSAASDVADEQAGAAAPIGPGVRKLFSNTMRDFRQLPTRETFMWLTIGAGASSVALPSDARVTTTLAGSNALHEALEAGDIIGGAPVQLGGALATYAIGRFTRNRLVTSVGADLVQVQAVAESMTLALKVTVRRTRPDGASLSFPSGHAAAAFGSATVLERHFGWRVGIPAYAVAAYVAASRVQMRRHYPSDVMFGAVIGMAAGRTVTIGSGDRRFLVAPTAVPGGGGITLSWIGQH